MADVLQFRPAPSPTYALSYYRGYVIEPTPMGRWVFYVEGPNASEPSDAATIADAVRLIDWIKDGNWPAPPPDGDPYAIRWVDLAAALAVSVLIVAMTIWLVAVKS